MTKMTYVEALSLLVEKTKENTAVLKSIENILEAFSRKAEAKMVRLNLRAVLSDEKRSQINAGTHTFKNEPITAKIAFGQENAGNMCVFLDQNNRFQAKIIDNEGFLALDTNLSASYSSESVNLVIFDFVKAETKSVDVELAIKAGNVIAQDAALLVDSSQNYINSIRLSGKNTDGEQVSRYLVKGQDRLTITNLDSNQALSADFVAGFLANTEGGEVDTSGIDGIEEGMYKFEVVAKEGVNVTKTLYIGNKYRYVAKEAVIKMDVSGRYISKLSISGRNDEDEQAERYLLRGKDRLTIAYVDTGAVIFDSSTPENYEFNNLFSFNGDDIPSGASLPMDASSGNYKFTITTREGLTVEKIVQID